MEPGARFSRKLSWARTIFTTRYLQRLGGARALVAVHLRTGWADNVLSVPDGLEAARLVERALSPSVEDSTPEQPASSERSSGRTPKMRSLRVPPPCRRHADDWGRVMNAQLRALKVGPSLGVL